MGSKMTCGAGGRQKGVALITVMLVFAIATIVAAEVASRNYRDIRKTANLFNSKQAYHYALSGEQYAREILYRDYYEQKQQGIKADTLDDKWAQNFEPFKIDGGDMSIEIHDLQGRFNVNNLVNSGGSVNGMAVTQFRKLLNGLAIQRDYTALVVDWMDADKNRFADGAEDPDYQGDYLPANRPLVDKSELLMVKDMDPQDYLKLAPYITALPKKLGKTLFDATKYNLNTADAKLLKAVGLSAGEADAIKSRQEQGGFDTLQQWLSTPEGGKLASGSSLFTIRSDFFEVVVKASYQQRISILTSYLYRNPEDGAITIIKRQIGAGLSPSHAKQPEAT